MSIPSTVSSRWRAAPRRWHAPEHSTCSPSSHLPPCIHPSSPARKNFHPPLPPFDGSEPPSCPGTLPTTTMRMRKTSLAMRRDSITYTCMEKKTSMPQEFYQITVKGHLNPIWADWFDGLTITLEDNGETLLTGPVVDQAALHGLLRKVRDLGMPLLSVTRVRPSQADA